METRLTEIPAGIPAVGRACRDPCVSAVQHVLVVTVQHDGGTDLIVPATLAATGQGWAVMDGGSVASPGAIVPATSCVRLNADPGADHAEPGAGQPQCQLPAVLPLWHDHDRPRQRGHR